MIAVAKLEGAELALWVARALNLKEPQLVDNGNGEGPSCLYVHHYEEGDDGWEEAFSPHTNWEQGGPLIDRFAINLGTQRNEPGFRTHPSRMWHAQVDQRVHVAYGPTPLVAAMRVLVASVFGAEVTA